MLQAYEWFLWGMAALAVVVFIALYHVKAGYGLLRDGRWGPKIGNRLGWFLMESPVFIAMCLFWFCSSRRFEATPLVFFGLFQLHYLNRAFIYPLLLKGQSKMPLGIIVMGNSAVDVLGKEADTALGLDADRCRKLLTGNESEEIGCYRHTSGFYGAWRHWLSWCSSRFIM